MDKLKSLIDTIPGRTVNEVTKRLARGRDQTAGECRDGSLIAAVNTRERERGTKKKVCKRERERGVGE